MRSSEILVICSLVAGCLIAKPAFCEMNYDLSKDDVFGVTHINEYSLVGEFVSINEFLVKNTGSTKPRANFNILNDSLIRDLRNTKNQAIPKIEAKKLFLALSTINDGNICGPYAKTIISMNNNALKNRLILKLKAGDVLKRTEKIVATYLEKHARDCSKVYMDKFNKLFPVLDRDQVDLVEKFLAKAIENLTSESKNRLKPELTETYSDQLFCVAKGEVDTDRAIGAEYVSDFIKGLAKENPEDANQIMMENEIMGRFSLDVNKFKALYLKYIKNPCQYYNENLGSIFDPVSFGALFYHEVQKKEVEFYKAWAQYVLCSDYRLKDILLLETIKYIDFGAYVATLP